MTLIFEHSGDVLTKGQTDGTENFTTPSGGLTLNRARGTAILRAPLAPIEGLHNNANT